MNSKSVSVKVDGPVAIVTLTHPPVNALDGPTRTGLTSTLDAIADDTEIRAVILTAAGDVFSAGADLNERRDADAPGYSNRIYREASNAADAISECPKPVIAAVNGAAVGAGFILVASCDIILASSSAVFGMPEINVGLIGGASLLQQLFGRSRARRMLYTGELFTADELYRLGVIEGSIPREQLMVQAMALATSIASKNPIGIKYAKLAANMLRPMGPPPNARLEQDLTTELLRTDEGREAIRAFIESRSSQHNS